MIEDPLNSGWLFGVSGLFSSPDVELKILKDQIDTSDPAQAQNIKVALKSNLTQPNLTYQDLAYSNPT